MISEAGSRIPRSVRHGRYHRVQAAPSTPFQRAHYVVFLGNRRTPRPPNRPPYFFQPDEKPTSFFPRPRLLAVGFFLLLVALVSSCSTKPEEPEEIITRRKQADSLMTQGHERTDELAYDVARISYDAALGIYASLDYREGTIAALLALGRNSRMTGNPAAAEELFDHAEALAVGIGNPRFLRDVLNHKADLALRSGNPVAAAAYLEETPVSVSGGRERAAQLRLLGTVRHTMGDGEEAQRLLLESVAVAEAADEKVEAAQSYYKLASIASLDARFDEALSWAGQALASDKAAEYRPGIAADLRALAIISAKAGAVADAEDYFRRSWLAWRGLGRYDDAEDARSELEKLIGLPVTVP